MKNRTSQLILSTPEHNCYKLYCEDILVISLCSLSLLFPRNISLKETLLAIRTWEFLKDY